MSHEFGDVNRPELVGVSDCARVVVAVGGRVAVTVGTSVSVGERVNVRVIVGVNVIVGVGDWYWLAGNAVPRGGRVGVEWSCVSCGVASSSAKAVPTEPSTSASNAIAATVTVRGSKAREGSRTVMAGDVH